MRRELEGRAASPVAVDQKTVRLEIPRRGRRGVERGSGLLELILDLGEGARPLRADTAERDSLRRQALVGVVGAQRQAKLRPRGEHAIRFGDSMGREIVDHHPQVGLSAVECCERLAAGLARGVDSRNCPWAAASS